MICSALCGLLFRDTLVDVGVNSFNGTDNFHRFNCTSIATNSRDMFLTLINSRVGNEVFGHAPPQPYKV